MNATLRRNAARLAALAFAGAALLLNLPPGLSAKERSELASRFALHELALPDGSGQPRSIRSVNPSVKRIQAWISAVGAGIALNDLDADGRENDACQVDPRYDSVTVYPLPGTGARYRPIRLEPHGLRYDRRTMAPMGCVPGDLDEDGRMDLLVYYWGRPPILFMAESGRYRPRELSDAHSGEIWNSNAATLADVDGDGHTDVIVGNYFRDGDRVLDAHAKDGISMQKSMSRATNGGIDRIFLSTAGEGGRGPLFREAMGALSDRVARGWTLAIGAQDLNGDLLPELYLAHDFGSDRLLLNESTPGHVRLVEKTGGRSISTLGSRVIGRDSFKGMGIDFGDLNGDAVPDMFVSNIAAEFALQESNFAWISTGRIGPEGDAPYEERSEDLGLARSGWGWDSRLADLDNDGGLEALQATGFVRGETDRWPELQELAMGNDQLLDDPDSWPRFGRGTDLNGHDRNALYARFGDGGRFHDIAADVGFGRRQVSRGLALADIDGDGDLDFAVANQWQRSYLYRNDCPATCGRSLGLKLLVGGARPGLMRPAIGASVTVRRADGRVLIGQVDGGNGHSGKRGNELLFGLGHDARPVHVEVRWRDPGGTPRRLETPLTPGRHTLLLDRWRHP